MQNWEGELASTLSDLKLTRRIACPCVWKGCIKGEDVVATVHGDDITIGGERSVVELFIRMISRKCEIKKQVIGEDADLEKSGRKLYRVIVWGRDGTTLGARRETLKDLGLERANHSAVPCTWKGRMSNARSDESEGENRRGQGRTQTKHEWDGMSDGDDRDRPQKAGDAANDSQARTAGDITEYRAFVARISHLSQDRPDLKFASMRV